jgi:hypothetical protein
MTLFDFEIFALPIAVPFLDLPALENPSFEELEQREAEIGYHSGLYGREKALAQIMVDFLYILEGIAT